MIDDPPIATESLLAPSGRVRLLVPLADLVGAKLSELDGFVLSRIDQVGETTIANLVRLCSPLRANDVSRILAVHFHNGLVQYRPE